MARIWKTIIALSPLFVFSGAEYCPSNKFYTPTLYCDDPWSCQPCPSHSVQMVTEDKTRYDEACMCIAGYTAGLQAWKCGEGRNEGNSGVYPLVREVFTCTLCNFAIAYDCTGGVIQSRKDYRLPNEEEYYVACTSCPSGYRRISAVELKFRSEDMFYRHSPGLKCKIYGQNVTYPTEGCR